MMTRRDWRLVVAVLALGLACIAAFVFLINSGFPIPSCWPCAYGA